MPRKNNTIKSFSAELNSIIHLKRLTERQGKIIFNKLTRFIKSTASGEFDFVKYVKIVITDAVTSDEKKTFVSRMEEASNVKETIKDPLLEYKLLGAYYTAIVEYYPDFRIEYVCYEINEVLPESFLLESLVSDAKQDEEFKKKLEEKTKRKKKKSDKPLSTLSSIQDLERFLKKNIIGQDEAIRAVRDAIKLKAADFSTHMNLFFIGKTGRGKTQLARKLGEKYSKHFWVINCAEFTNGHEVSRLLGSPPGYIGHSESSLIKEKADKSNRWTIVFDEIEKAHPKLYNILLSLLDTGTITDNSGNEIDLTDSIFIMTSNCGLKDLKTETVGFRNGVNSDGDKEQIMKSIEATFSPEFRGRVDEFVFFNDLTQDDIKQIAKLALAKYPIKATPEIIDYIIKHGYSEEFGARDIQRVLKRLVGLPLADEILANRQPDNGTGKYDAEVRENKLEIINTFGSSSL
jgi:ATP-dependent Clp protease ATP-binding subunit ClpA|tara:strand:- start:965 stop:2347 length:1383 start_codon:yes stop_codon:yes gene_type:complete